MNEAARQHLREQLESLKPERLLLVSRLDQPDLEEWLGGQGQLQRTAGANGGESQLGRYDLAVVVDFLEYLDKPEGLRQLARIRNLHSQRMWVLIKQNDGWTFSDFIGLGFKRHGDFPENEHCYGYELASYNRVRSWNNPRFWAHPENFHKYRW